jgi:hypothetical protein
MGKRSVWYKDSSCRFSSHGGAKIQAVTKRRSKRLRKTANIGVIADNPECRLADIIDDRINFTRRVGLRGVFRVRTSISRSAGHQWLGADLRS